MADESTAGAAPIKRVRRKAARRKTATRKSAKTKKSPAARPKAELEPGAEASADGRAAPPQEALINWAAVKRRYQNKRRMKVADIAVHYGLDEKRLREIARERRWLRPDSQPKRPRTPPTIRDRMLVLADGHLTQLEMQMETDAMPDLPESTRKLRDINQMVGGKDPNKQGSADGAPERAAGSPTKAGDTDAERWRLELVERIKKLKQKLEAQ